MNQITDNLAYRCNYNAKALHNTSHVFLFFNWNSTMFQDIPKLWKFLCGGGGGGRGHLKKCPYRTGVPRHSFYCIHIICRIFSGHFPGFPVPVDYPAKEVYFRSYICSPAFTNGGKHVNKFHQKKNHSPQSYFNTVFFYIFRLWEEFFIFLWNLRILWSLYAWIDISLHNPGL